MPTIRPRHQVTETPEVAAALDRAADRWPGEPRGRLLVRLVELADRTMSQQRADLVAARLAAVRASAGEFDDCYHPGYLAELREDWPE